MPTTIPAALLDALKDFAVPADASLVIVAAEGRIAVQVHCCCATSLMGGPPDPTRDAAELRAKLDELLVMARQERDAKHQAQAARAHDTQASALMRRALGTQPPMEQ